MKKNKKILKYVLGFGVGLIVSGSFYGVASSTFGNSKKTSFSTSAQLPGQNQMKGSPESYYEQYKLDSVDALGTKMYNYCTQVLNLSPEDALANSKNRINEYLHQLDLEEKATENQSENIRKKADSIGVSFMSTKTAAISKVNNDFNINVDDHYLLKNFTIDNELSSLRASLSHDGQSKKNIDAICSKASSAMDKISNFEDSHVVSTLESNLNLLTLMKPSNVNLSKLNVVFSDITKKIDKNLAINNDTVDKVVDKILVYNDAQQGYKTGDEFDVKDLANLFTWRYDLTYGMDLPKMSFDMNAFVSTDKNTITKKDNDFCKVMPLTEHRIQNVMNYNIGEVLPGYTIHAKIVKEDYNTDSSICKLNLQFGLSDTVNDPKNQNVIWEQDNKNTAITHSFDLPIKTLNEHKNIASNVYYKGLQWDVKNQKTNSFGAYFEDTKNKNSYLNVILQQFESGDSYDFSNAYVEISDFKGVPFKKLISKDHLHKNQKQMVKINGVDTINNIVNISLVVCDYSIHDLNNEVYRYNILTDKGVVDNINVQDIVDPSLQMKLDVTYLLIHTYSSIHETSASYDTINDSWIKNADAYVNAKLAFSVIDTAAAVTATAISVVQTAIAWATMSASECAKAVVGCTFAGLCTAASIWQNVEAGKEKESIDGVKNYKKTFSDPTIRQNIKKMEYDFSLLLNDCQRFDNDPSLNYTVREKIADEVIGRLTLNNYSAMRNILNIYSQLQLNFSGTSDDLYDYLKVLRGDKISMKNNIDTTEQKALRCGYILGGINAYILDVEGLCIGNLLVTLTMVGVGNRLIANLNNLNERVNQCAIERAEYIRIGQGEINMEIRRYSEYESIIDLRYLRLAEQDRAIEVYGAARSRFIRLGDQARMNIINWEMKGQNLQGWKRAMDTIPENERDIDWWRGYNQWKQEYDQWQEEGQTVVNTWRQQVVVYGEQETNAAALRALAQAEKMGIQNDITYINGMYPDEVEIYRLAHFQEEEQGFSGVITFAQRSEGVYATANQRYVEATAGLVAQIAEDESKLTCISLGIFWVTIVTITVQAASVIIQNALFNWSDAFHVK